MRASAWSGGIVEEASITWHPDNRGYAYVDIGRGIVLSVYDRDDVAFLRKIMNAAEGMITKRDESNGQGIPPDSVTLKR